MRNKTLKDTLKTGMIVTKRNGDIRRVFLNTLHDTSDVIVGEHGEWDTLNNYNDDLTHKGNELFDIVRICYNDGVHDLCMPIEDVYIREAWKYVEPKEMTITEIESILGYPIKVVQE